MFQAILEALLPFLKQAQQQKRSQNSILLRINLNSIATTLQFFPSNVTPLQQYYNFFPAVYIHYNNTTIFSQQCNSITTTLQFFPQESNSITTTLVRYHQKEPIFGSFRHVAINIAHLWTSINLDFDLDINLGIW